MNLSEPQPVVPTPSIRWFHLAPGRLLAALLAVEGLLWLSNRLDWPEWHKGYAVLTCVAVLGVAALGMLLWFAVALLFRLRFHFSIGSLLVLTVAVAAAFGWLATEKQEAERQQATVKKLLGEVVDYDWQFNADGYQLHDAQPLEPAWLRSLLGETFFANVAWTWADSDAEMESMESFPHLQGLQIKTDAISPDRLHCLKKLSKLRGLAIAWTATDAWLEHLESLPELRSLLVHGKEVTGRGLLHLKALTNLEMLFLDRTSVTDADLVCLEGLTNLRFLSLDGSKITPEGREKLRKKLPNCCITPGNDGIDEGHLKMLRDEPTD